VEGCFGGYARGALIAFEGSGGDRLVKPFEGREGAGGGSGRRVDQPDPLRDGQSGGAAPAGVVEDPCPSGARRFGERGEERREEGFVDAVREAPEGLAAGRLDEGGDGEPRAAVM
jgi:hypothetical protein